MPRTSTTKICLECQKRPAAIDGLCWTCEKIINDFKLKKDPTLDDILNSWKKLG